MKRNWVILALGIFGVFCYAQSNSSKPDYLAGSLPRDEPQAIYAPDANDSWNRIFYGLFTRTVQARLSHHFPEAAPFQRAEVMSQPDLTVSEKTFACIESGDRAIDPLYPSFFSSKGPFEALSEPRGSRLENALTDALAEKTVRPATQRALMQSDVWAAYDILARNFSYVGEDAGQQREIQKRLLPLLARFIKKLALMPEEISALPDNYALAARQHKLPKLFDPKSGWMEVDWVAHREHDVDFKYRRSTRIFFKPKVVPKSPPEKTVLLHALQTRQVIPNQVLDSVALAVQNLLIDATGKVVPSPLTFEVQIRHLAKNDGDKARFAVYELNRQLFFANPRSGGLKELSENEPTYLPTAGNDLTFASPHSQKERAAAPILAPLRSRCVSCHGENLQEVMMLNQHFLHGEPLLRPLDAAQNKRSTHVAQQKTGREEFKALLARWASEAP